MTEMITVFKSIKIKKATYLMKYHLKSGKQDYPIHIISNCVMMYIIRVRWMNGENDTFLLYTIQCYENEYNLKFTNYYEQIKFF